LDELVPFYPHNEVVDDGEIPSRTIAKSSPGSRDERFPAVRWRMYLGVEIRGRSAARTALLGR
jgi:hypothetical protein